MTPFIKKLETLLVRDDQGQSVSAEAEKFIRLAIAFDTVRHLGYKVTINDGEITMIRWIKPERK